MAKQKFPGKALKLNQRERLKFFESEVTPECRRLIEIKKGLKLFRNLFGDSDEDSFEGFESAGCTSRQNGYSGSVKLPHSRIQKQPSINGDKEDDENSSESNEFSQTIALYADSIAEEADRLEVDDPNNAGSDSKLTHLSTLSPKKEKAKRKIEKILRSQWAERLKNKELLKHGDVAVCSSKNILRKPRLNLNNETLLKIRSPASSQKTSSPCEEDQSGRCSFCCSQSTKLAIVFGVSCCDSCSQFVAKVTAQKNVLVCLGGHGGCQLVGLPQTERCQACWLLKVFTSCSIPVVIHDKLRKLLPNGLREKIPTSLAQESPTRLPTCGLNGTQDQAIVVDLPGGWKRKTDGEIVVISPSGDVFHDLQQLQSYIENHGIKADPLVMFGTAYKLNHENRIPTPNLQGLNPNKVVTTNLPGGWFRVTKWDGSGSLVETLVSSPDGKTFSSSKELHHYFQCIGKVDDMNKYFPLEESAQSIRKSRHKKKKKKKSKENRTSINLSNFCDTSEDLDELDTSDSTVLDLSSFSPKKTFGPKRSIKPPRTPFKASAPDKSEDSTTESSVHREVLVTPSVAAESNDLSDPDIPTAPKELPSKKVKISSNPKSKHFSPICAMLFPSESEEELDFDGFCEPKIIPLPPKKIKGRPPIKGNKLVTKEKLKDNWSRKVKWNDKKEGKVLSVTSPEGQRFKSSIELMAYFKKSQLPHEEANYYFPKELLKEKIQKKIESTAAVAAVEESRLVSDSKPKIKVQKQQLSGPRVKNVCRTQAQVLGKPLAIFSKKNKSLSINNLSPGEKVLKKTMWCGKCSGCSKPNCRKCVNCLDMKKYGGPGCKKKPCLLRKCSNPRLSFKTKVIPKESSSNPESSCGYSSENLCEDLDKKEESWIKPLSKPHNINEKWDSSVVHTETIFPKEQTEEPKKTNSCKINIDHWSDDVSSGLPVIVTEPLDIPLCFQCGSAGTESLLYCSVCCEGYHPFCLDEGLGPQSEYEELFWVCQRCICCHVCGDYSNDLMQCASCGKAYHPFCIEPQDHKLCLDFELPWLCGSCSKCISCGSPNVADFSKWPITEESEVSAPFCNKCLLLHNKLDFCPVCFCCYDEEDFSLKMMECANCNRWIHSQCEGITDDLYQILSQLDNVDYVCCLCVDDNSSWLNPIQNKFNENFRTLLENLMEKGFRRTQLNGSCDLTNRKCLIRNRPLTLPTQDVISSTPVKNAVPRVCKDIDDDCLSSEESDYPETESDLESLDEDDDPKCFEEILAKFNKGSYKTLLEAHIDISRVIRRDCRTNLYDECKDVYEKQLDELFSWFKVSEQDVFEIVDRKTVVPIPSNDHEYLLSKDSVRQCNSKYWNLLKRKAMVKRNIVDPRKCVFCGILGDSAPDDAGRLLYHGQDEWVHVNCSLWSSEVYENEQGCLQNIATAVTRGKQIKCSWCQEKGATIGCCHKSCGVTYHLNCARKAQCVFMKDRRVFCSQHGDNKQDVCTDFAVNRRILIDLQSERKRWKTVNDRDVNVNVGSLRVTRLGKIIPGAETESVMYPNEYVCSRLYWSAFNPLKRVWYKCRIKVLPSDCQEVVAPTVEYNDTIDYSQDPDIVEAKTLKMKEWHVQLERQLVKNYDSTRVVPTHLCPMYQKILKQDEQVVDLREESPVEKVSTPNEEDTRKICKVMPITKSANRDKKSKKSAKYCMKRNYKTVIKNFSNETQSKPIKTFQIEINETIEMPKNRQKKRKLRRRFSTVLDTNTNFTTAKDNQSSVTDDESISNNIVQISNHINNITVSIMDNNNVLPKKKKRLRDTTPGRWRCTHFQLRR